MIYLQLKFQTLLKFFCGFSVTENWKSALHKGKFSNLFKCREARNKASQRGAVGNWNDKNTMNFPVEKYHFMLLPYVSRQTFLLGEKKQYVYVTVVYNLQFDNFVKISVFHLKFVWPFFFSPFSTFHFFFSHCLFPEKYIPVL